MGISGDHNTDILTAPSLAGRGGGARGGAKIVAITPRSVDVMVGGKRVMLRLGAAAPIEQHAPIKMGG